VVLALSMVAILAMAGLLLDSGIAWVNRRDAQTAADTAALAAVKAMAANNLADDPAVRHTAAVSAANAMSATNGFPAGSVSCPGQAAAQGVVVNNPPLSGPHTGDNLYVEVIATGAMNTTFARIVGQNCWLVSARAVAQLIKSVTTTPGSAYPAILAAYGPSPCSNKAYDNSAQFTVYGDVISDSGMHDSSTGTHYNGKITYVANPPNGCGTQTVISGSTTTTSPTAYPVTYTFDTTAHTVKNNVTGSTVACTYWFAGGTNLGNGAWWQGGSSGSGQLNPGVYCATGDIGLSAGSNPVGNVTFVGTGKITISAGHVNLTPYWDSMLAYSTSNDPTNTVINFSGSNGQWAGLIFAPSGGVRVSGSGNYAYLAALWGQTVITTGTGWTLDSRGMTTPSTSSSIDYRVGTLVE